MRRNLAQASPFEYKQDRGNSLAELGEPFAVLEAKPQEGRDTTKARNSRAKFLLFLWAGSEWLHGKIKRLAASTSTD